MKQGEEEYTLHLPDPVTLELELEDKMTKRPDQTPAGN